MRIVIAGHVDHGKSTLAGRLLHDTGSLSDGKKEELEEICRSRGIDLEWSFLLDAFQAERDQVVTIDTTQVSFKTALRSYILIDAPGHVEFLKNMVSGAAQAESGILVVDALEGLQEQTRRHAQILTMLGIEQIIVVVNKMDAAAYDQKVFKKVSGEIAALIEPFAIIPLAARHGEMIFDRGQNMNWYSGKTLVESLDDLELGALPFNKPLRFSVQDIYRFEGKRVIAGRVESGTLKVGDEILFSPYNQSAKIETIETWPAENKTQAQAGEVIGITLDAPLFVERGHIGSAPGEAPILSPVFRARLFQLTNHDLKTGDHFLARFGTYETRVSVQSVENAADRFTEVTLRARRLLPIDSRNNIVLSDGRGIIAAGKISMEGYPDQRRETSPKSSHIRRVDHLLDHDARAEMNGHRGGVFWLTGLSGAGKSTLAMMVEKALFDRGCRGYVLDGDNIRHGLNADLGFSPADRAENIRRVGQVAALMADAGLIVVTAFISPYRADREHARAAAGGRFREIYIRADLGTCEARDPKGLYKKARAGAITGFTGIDSPYEAPDNPDLVIDTQNNNIEDCVRVILNFIEEQTALPNMTSRKERVFAIY